MTFQLHYCLGLPRTCSTILMKILNENPRIFTTGTCPMPSFIEACQEKIRMTPECISLDKDVLNESYINFLRQGMRGWYEAMTDKPIVISKSRSWVERFTQTFAIDPNSKYIILLRDLRDIICSFESLIWKYPYLIYGGDKSDSQFYKKSFKERIQLYCTHQETSLGRSLGHIPHVMEMISRHPDNFLICRQEDFNKEPQKELKRIYDFLGEEYFEHDLNNVPESEYYEHDTVYQGLVSHKTENKFKKIENRWSKVMTEEESELVLENNIKYYNTFYPDLEIKSSTKIKYVKNKSYKSSGNPMQLG